MKHFCKVWSMNSVNVLVTTLLRIWHFEFNFISLCFYRSLLESTMWIWMRIRNLKLISIKDFVTLSKKMSDRTKIRYPHPLWIVSAIVLLCTTQNKKRRIICHSLNEWKKETEWKSAIQPNARKILIIYHVKKCSWMRIFARNDREWLKAWWFYVSNSQLCFTQTMMHSRLGKK